MWTIARFRPERNFGWPDESLLRQRFSKFENFFHQNWNSVIKSTMTTKTPPLRCQLYMFACKANWARVTPTARHDSINGSLDALPLSLVIYFHSTKPICPEWGVRLDSHYKSDGWFEKCRDTKCHRRPVWYCW